MATNRESGDGRKITKKDILGEAEEKLAALSLEPNRPIMAANTAAGTFGTPFHVQTNVFGVKLEDSISIWRYDVAVFAEIKGKRAVFFTKKSRDEYVSFVFKSISTA
uniref:BPH_3 domain-containing protein n=1 Tax=Angiostrongylus cantonensis TaxID=6313 RepID=A0A0K0CYJ7_ANGCA